MPRFKENTLWQLSGPAAGEWYALVLSGERSGAGSLPEVVVTPARAGLTADDASRHDIVCSANASPTGELLVFAAWAIAPIPANCLDRELGSIDQMHATRIQ